MSRFWTRARATNYGWWPNLSSLVKLMEGMQLLQGRLLDDRDGDRQGGVENVQGNAPQLPQLVEWNPATGPIDLGDWFTRHRTSNVRFEQDVKWVVVFADGRRATSGMRLTCNFSLYSELTTYRSLQRSFVSQSGSDWKERQRHYFLWACHCNKERIW